MLRHMKRGAVLVDVSIDQGGCFETSHPTTHADPTFEVDGIIHYCVANMPGAVPVTSAQALNNATLPFVIKLADKGLAAFDRDPHLAAGLNVRDGRIMHSAVAASLGFDGGSWEKHCPSRLSRRATGTSYLGRNPPTRVRCRSALPRADRLFLF